MALAGFQRRNVTGRLRERVECLAAALPGDCAAGRALRKIVRSWGEVSYPGQHALCALFPGPHTSVPILQGGCGTIGLERSAASLLVLRQQGGGRTVEQDVGDGRVQALAGCARDLYRQPEDRWFGDDRLFPTAHDLAGRTEQRPSMRLVGDPV